MSVIQFTSGEKEKSGFANRDEIDEAINLFLSIKQQVFVLKGLMTIGTVRTDQFEDEARRCFVELAEHQLYFQEKYDLTFELSMGMSRDYHLALEHGSHWVRIGREVFE